MQTVHLKKDDAFTIFIENAGGSWFEISGQGKIALSPGKYVDSSEAENRIQSLCSVGYKRQQHASNS